MAKVNVTGATDFADAETSLIKALTAVQDYKKEGVIPVAYLRAKTNKVDKTIDSLTDKLIESIISEI